MLCERILGTLTDQQFVGLTVEYVDVEWHEAFSRLHRKTLKNKEELGIRLDHNILTRGLRQNDVLYADGERVIAVNIPACDAIRAKIRQDHPEQIAKLCYEVGNTHTTMFRGEDAFTFYTPYYDALMEKISRIHGVEAKKVTMRFDFDRALSGSINDHHH